MQARRSHKPAVCVERVRATLCAFGSESQPPRWGQASVRTLPQRGGVTRNRGNRVMSQDVAQGRGEETTQPRPGAQAVAACQGADAPPPLALRAWRVTRPASVEEVYRDRKGTSGHDWPGGGKEHAADAQGGNQVRGGAAREIVRGSAETPPPRCGTDLKVASHSVGASEAGFRGH